MTFNEFLPDLSFTQGSTFIDYMFEISGQDILDKIHMLLGVGSEETSSLNFSFRTLHGNRNIDPEILSNSLIQQLIEAGMENKENQTLVLYLLTQRKWYKWRKLLDNVYLQTYAPIENYDMKEDETTEFKGSETDTETKTAQNSNTDTEISSSSSQATNSASSQKNVYAFNSDSFSPSDSDSGNSQSEGSDTSNTQSERSGTLNESSSSSHYFNERMNVRNKRLHGNLGVTTSQQMLESEVLLRLRNDFFEQFFTDLCDIFFELVY